MNGSLAWKKILSKQKPVILISGKRHHSTLCFTAFSIHLTCLSIFCSEIKCGWLIFTIGQNSGFYCSPNKTYDEIVGRKESRLSKRDL
ncbi:MAG: hypothetical protein ACP5OB_08625, partial [Candidatus Ratteibacteria bacterium]